MASLYLENEKGDRVELSAEIAKKLFGTVSNADNIATMASANAARVEDVEDVSDNEESAAVTADGEEDVPLQLTGLKYDKIVLDVVVQYAELPDSERTEKIPCPLSRPLDRTIKTNEMDLMKTAEEQKYLMPLLDCATHLRFGQLQSLCAAFISTRVDDIARNAPSIMEGAELIRQYLNIPNEWTEEEMGHLKKEMEYAKSADPNAY